MNTFYIFYWELFLSRSIAHFKNLVICFLDSLVVLISFYILGINPLSDVQLEKIFLTLWVFFTRLIVSLAMQKLCNLMKPCLSIVSQESQLWVLVPRYSWINKSWTMTQINNHIKTWGRISHSILLLDKQTKKEKKMTSNYWLFLRDLLIYNLSQGWTC